ncbi:MAG: aminopeptidase P family protein [Phycisphaerae bacterium]|nr:aminopeptidase P family protein [Phycisphaerae bacterium]
MAGIPATNLSLYHRLRFLVGDPTALIEIPGGGATFILRDIELDRARKHARADHFACPADFAPPGGALSGDRETATAQAAAECLRRAGVKEVWTDRTLPVIFAHFIEEAGITVRCDTEMGVMERRAKDEEEVAFLGEAQRTTEACIEMVCRLIAGAKAGDNGVLVHDGSVLTSERVMQEIDVWLLRRGYANDVSIVAGGTVGSDCHDRGHGALYTEQPIIVDIFPRNKKSLYNGDCTRVVVHGKPGNIPEAVREMHAAVVEAKRAAIAATRAGVSGEAVHAATTKSIVGAGFAMGLPGPNDPPTRCAMVHGTGHGVGLSVHEPPLLDKGGPPLIAGDCLTIEPGLYCPAIGGVRIEDMVIVREGGCENLNTLHEGLTWL